MAGEHVRKQIVVLAARVLGVPESDIDVEDGRATGRGGNKPSITLGELARLAQGMPGFSFAAGQAPGLEHTAYFTPQQASYCNGTHVAEVEVDPFTGGVTLLAYTVAHDSGNIINPLIVDGQVQGGVAHGIGNALFEWMKYDADAQPLTTSFQDYLLPAAPDVPGCTIEHVETPNPLNPLGVKGAGEGGTIPAPAAIIAAIEDALSPVRRAVCSDAIDARPHRRRRSATPAPTRSSRRSAMARCAADLLSRFRCTAEARRTHVRAPYMYASALSRAWNAGVESCPCRRMQKSHADCARDCGSTIPTIRE